MTLRDSNLQQLIDLSERIIASSGDPRAMAAGQRVFERLRAGEGPIGAVAAQRLPVCHHNIGAALAGLAAEASPLPEMASAFAAVEGRLQWTRRRNAEAVGEPFFSGHANAVLVGPGGLEQREDAWIGVTVMAPGIVYPDHDHPPEEVYIALSPGEWWNAEMDWTAPGPGGLIYNPPGILHAMRSHDEPFLALWFLPLG
ncbi:dimethylsulfonioproprionate lyase family protein [Aestuariivirga litoralis]|nr:dimethylsulfonioproprionate lyase family protein [Aestuariivirga litoralis]